MKCPKCGSAELMGLVAAFWLKLDENESADLTNLDISSETEITDRRCCCECAHEFDAE